MHLGFWEIVAVLGVALLFFGPKRLPDLGRSIGEAIRGFKKGIEGTDETPSIANKTSSGQGNGSNHS